MKNKKIIGFSVTFLILITQVSLAQNRIQVPKNKLYKEEKFSIDTTSKKQSYNERNGQEASKNLNTSVDQKALDELEELFNSDLSEAERSQAKATIAVFTEMIQEDSANIAAFINRGTYWAQLGLHVQAIKDYDAALEIDPEQPVIYYNRAISKARFFYTYDACLDLQKAGELGLPQAVNLLAKKCGRHLPKLQAAN